MGVFFPVNIFWNQGYLEVLLINGDCFDAELPATVVNRNSTPGKDSPWDPSNPEVNSNL